MKIYTLNKNERVTRKELKHASLFMMAHLLGEVEHKKVRLTIESRRNMRNRRGERLTGRTYPNNKDKWRFKIAIDKLFSRKKQLLTLAHELVHVKQFIRCELGETLKKDGIEFTRWHGEYVTQDEDEYDEWPWEIEARGREYGLYRKWENYLRKNKIKYG